MLLFGCKSTDNEVLVITESTYDNVAVAMSAVTREDVILSKNISCTYTQTKEQTISFPVGGKRVSRVYVSEGDTVNVGDLLVKLDDDNLEEQILDLEYKIERNTLLLSYLDKAEEFEKAQAYNNFVYGKDTTDEEALKEYQKLEASIEQNYKYKREDYIDEISFDQKELDRLKAELANSRIYSNMSGVVYKIADRLEGSTTKKGDVVMTIVDNANGIFEVSAGEYAEYLKSDEVVSMTISYGKGAGDYLLKPIDIQSWGEKQYFVIFEGEKADGLEVGNTGTIKAVIDKRENVLSLPIGAVHLADGKSYVYVLDENDLRQIVYIETGLVGDNRIEIIGGLKEGDQVIYK